MLRRSMVVMPLSGRYFTSESDDKWQGRWQRVKDNTPSARSRKNTATPKEKVEEMRKDFERKHL
ncbi:hypothetical protein [Salinisphaera aquimarina]|uniref:Uncharacterized protein n=1 Tax=Salinisphaera aquimarina TaxID=2094031 RepID=A0ABV7EM61_9GAMM